MRAREDLVVGLLAILFLLQLYNTFFARLP